MPSPHLVAATPEAEDVTRVLIVEDMPWDAELMTHELRRGGVNAETTCVETEAAFRQTLSDFQPDIVLADYTLPRFSGMKALSIIREAALDTPVILVSGTVTEETALECLDQGVADYMLKDNLLRLGPAVRAALRMRRLRRDRLRAEDHYRAMLEHLPVVVYEAGLDDRSPELWLGPQIERILGTPPQAWIEDRTLFHRRVHEDDRDRVARARRVGRAGGAMDIVYRIAHADGHFVWVRDRGVVGPSVTGDGSRVFRGVMLDVTAAQEAKQQRALLGAAVEQSTDITIITDPLGTIQYVNRSFERITGYEADEVVGKNPRVLKSGVQPAGFYERMWEDLTAGRPWSGDFVNLRKDGSEYLQASTIFPIQDADGRTVNYVGVGQDVTRERALQRQLRQSQKMETVGQLAAGIAHDLNNVLTSIVGNAELAQQTLMGDSMGHPELADIESAAWRGATLIKRLMTFSRDEDLHPEVVDPGELINEAVGLLRHGLPESIDLSIEEQHHGALIEADRTSIEQILVNLANNARDAMPDGGTITISTSIAGLGTEDSGAPGPSRVEIKVADTGVGMPPELLPRVFEPFFTTKAKGKGTGLGLAMVFGLVEAHGGQVDVTSEVGVGTTFTVGLPVAQAPPRNVGNVGDAADGGTDEAGEGAGAG